MLELKQKRRSVLMGLAGLGVGHVLLQSAAEAEGAASQGCVLGPAEGEHLVPFRNPGNIFIKVAPLKGIQKSGHWDAAGARGRRDSDPHPFRSG